MKKFYPRQNASGIYILITKIRFPKVYRLPLSQRYHINNILTHHGPHDSHDRDGEPPLIGPVRPLKLGEAPPCPHGETLLPRTPDACVHQGVAALGVVGEAGAAGLGDDGGGVIVDGGEVAPVGEGVNAAAGELEIYHRSIFRTVLLYVLCSMCTMIFLEVRTEKNYADHIMY